MKKKYRPLLPLHFDVCLNEIEMAALRWDIDTVIAAGENGGRFGEIATAQWLFCNVISLYTNENAKICLRYTPAYVINAMDWLPDEYAYRKILDAELLSMMVLEDTSPHRLGRWVYYNMPHLFDNNCTKTALAKKRILRKPRTAKFKNFLMGAHRRAGADSPVKMLVEDVHWLIWEFIVNE